MKQFLAGSAAPDRRSRKGADGRVGAIPDRFVLTPCWRGGCSVWLSLGDFCGDNFIVSARLTVRNMVANNFPPPTAVAQAAGGTLQTDGM